MTTRGGSLLPLFLISAASVGFEVALTRYFAVAKWSEYGYWVISIVMAGFALSGVVMALARGWAMRHGAALLTWLPVLMILAAAAGYHATVANLFNPLQLQNSATWQPQLGNIFQYYACLLPFFFLAGLYVSLSFVLNEQRIGRVYGADLTGAGAGSAAMLALMYVVHPFHLVATLLVPLGAAALLGLPLARSRGLLAAAALLAFAGGEAVLLLDDAAAYNEFKAIYAPLHVPDSRVVAQHRSPRGLYELLDDFTERVDTDVSNDSGMLGVAGPPLTLGLYRDGTRIAALPKPSGAPTGYARAALEALPYLLRPDAQVLLAGASGGFRIGEALTLGAAHVDALEPDPVLRDALAHGLGPSPAFPPNPRVTIHPDGPVAAALDAPARYDLVDLSADFLDGAEANAAAFTAEALAADLRALRPGGLLSVPVSIREFPVYAVRMLATVRQALLLAGVDDVPAHVVAYRSAWNVRILVGRDPWTAADLSAAKKFCDDRSFDLSWYPGMDPVASRAGIYNDLPAVSFEGGDVTSGSGPADSIADEALPVLQGRDSESQSAFNLAPITFDRPFFYNVLRLEHLGTILRRLEILPQAEIGALVNLVVLAQAVLLAVVVLLVPLASFGQVGAGSFGLLRPILYFPALGLGFLFIEIFLIEKSSFYLNDRTTGFALVLTGMLVFSGLGSMLADRAPRGTLALCSAVIVGWCALLLGWLQPFLLATLGLPLPVRSLIVLALLAPVSVALGLPFALGLRRAGGSGNGFLPWAWALNGAFSVVATPLANLVAQQAGFDRVLLCAGVLYVVAYVSYPSARKRQSWQDISAPSRDAA